MGSEDEERDGASVVYKMKIVQTLGRSVPIILQNDNGPCPLLAVSNVLLLRNNVTLSLDMSEITQRELMSLVAGWLLDANSNNQNKTDEYVKNQQQNIHDAISLLPRLATGLDVNVRFRHIHDFEFTRECAIFDLFHVGLAHGWLCDPQDKITAKVIGANSYNTLVEKLVTLHALKAERESEAETDARAEQEPTVDLAAATNATLGVPRPILLKSLSNVSSVSTMSSEYLESFRLDPEKPRRKGDDEEQAELLQALQLSQVGMDIQTPFEDVNGKSSDDQSQSSIEDPVRLLQNVTLLRPLDVSVSGHDNVSGEVIEAMGEDDMNHTVRVGSDSELDRQIPGCGFSSNDEERDIGLVETSSPMVEDFTLVQPHPSSADGDKTGTGIAGYPDSYSTISVGEAVTPSIVHGESYARSPSSESNVSIFTVGEDVKTTVDPLDLDYDEDVMVNQTHSRLSASESMSPKNCRPASESSFGHFPEESECASSCIDDDEPLYEGELTLAGSAPTFVAKQVTYEGIAGSQDKEPMYEGEAVLANQVLGEDDEGFANRRRGNHMLNDELTRETIREGLIIEKFLNDAASQLTYHGLFSLQEGLKENELYVFFRNNHFSTIYKHQGQIYLLATDQGYLNQPDLVWEKLSEVDGNSSFYTGNFQLFEVDKSSGSWSEQEAVAATAEYMSTHHGISGGAGGSYDMCDVPVDSSDYQLAMHLQREELAQQQQQQQQQHRSHWKANNSGSNYQQNSRVPGLGSSSLITGPTRSTGKAEKVKEKCTIM